jgi:hypothetical protein
MFFQQIFLKSPMLNFTKILPVKATLIHADGQRNEHNKGYRRFLRVCEKLLKTVQILGKEGQTRILNNF